MLGAKIIVSRLKDESLLRGHPRLGSLIPSRVGNNRMRHLLFYFGHAIERCRCELGTIVDRDLTYVAMKRYLNCPIGKECMGVRICLPPLLAVHLLLMLYTLLHSV